VPIGLKRPTRKEEFMNYGYGIGGLVILIIVVVVLLKILGVI
jgi:t-SNARE complex subunit (syntaxin)